MTAGPCQPSAASIQEPPASFREKLKYLGPYLAYDLALLVSIIAVFSLGVYGMVRWW